jgi:hypothetical protein
MQYLARSQSRGHGPLAPLRGGRPPTRCAGDSTTGAPFPIRRATPHPPRLPELRPDRQRKLLLPVPHLCQPPLESLAPLAPNLCWTLHLCGLCPGALLLPWWSGMQAGVRRPLRQHRRAPCQRLRCLPRRHHATPRPGLPGAASRVATGDPPGSERAWQRAQVVLLTMPRWSWGARHA